MRTYTRMLIAGIGLMLLLAAGQPVRGDDAVAGGNPVAPTGDEWTILMPTYLWASGLEGDITIRGNTANIDLGFDKIFDHTDVGFATYIEVRKEMFGFFVNPSYTALSVDGETTGGVKVEDKLSLWIVEAGGFYQVGKWGEDRPLTLDAYAGMRWWNMHNNLNISGVGSASSNRNLWDPMIGLRVRKHFTEKFFGSLRADIGGFDIGRDTSKFSWSVTPLIGYDFNKYFTGFVGWRELATDFGDENNGANIKMGGVMLGFNFDFFGWMAKK